MHRLKRKMAALCTVIVLMAGFVPAVHGAILEDVTEQQLMKGVTYKHMKRLEEGGWQDIHIVQADLNEPYLKFEVLRHPQGESFLQNTLEMAKDADALAAVNADFFAAKRGQAGRGSPVGIEIIDGVLRSTPATQEAMNALYQVKEDGLLYFNNFEFEISVKAPNGKVEWINSLNKYDDLNGVAMYTRDWNNLSLGSYGTKMEIVVKDDIVIDKRWQMDPAEIPENGYVLLADLSINTFLDDNLNVGDPVILNVATTPNFKNIETAVGGGGIILADGQVPTKFSHNITGLQPRSAVGVDKTGKILTIVAVDGRRSEAIGMTQTQLGYLMADLGCWNAMNLDGGGSTLMAIKEDGEHKVVNKPSDGSYRAVTNSIGITADTNEPAKLDSIQLKTDDANMFANTSRWLWIEGYDQYGRQMELEGEGQITKISGSGELRGSDYYPTEEGKAVFQASYGGKTANLEINVLEKPYTMAFDQEKITLNSGESTNLWLSGKDANGVKAIIYPRDADISFSNEIASMNGNKVVANSGGATVITASFGATNANMALMIDGAAEIGLPENKVIVDPKNKAAELTGEDSFRFTVFGNTRKPEKLFDLFMMNNATWAMKNNGAVHAFVGSDFDADAVQELNGDYFTAKNYFKFTRGTNTFIAVNNTSGKIYSSDKTQWDQLRSDMNSLIGSNVFIFLEKPTISDNETEVKKFKELMEGAAASGINVFVFGGGYKNEITVENGVRYLNTAGVFPSIALKGTSISYVKYILVTVNGSDVTYEYKWVLE